jgi:hypothetical protein
MEQNQSLFSPTEMVSFASPIGVCDDRSIDDCCSRPFESREVTPQSSQDKSANTLLISLKKEEIKQHQRKC